MPRPAAGGSGTPSASPAGAPSGSASGSASASGARTQAPAAGAASAAAAANPAGKTTAKPAAKAGAPSSGRSRLARGGLATAALLALFAIAVLVARWLVTQDSVQGFIAQYPGESHLPHDAPVGLPGWLGWQHFFNAFFMVLIIRSGWQVRTQRKPPASWTPRWGKNPKKISITLWLHQSLDLLWLVNGGIFVVLLAVTGQWMRVVPTSWDVFPNALSAALQYLSLDWPTENGWVNYNSLQVLAYFVTIFIAAPLAAASGFRMSDLWPSKAKRLSTLYPIEVARAIHLPVMFYFVGFIIVHVALVLSTGALRNLNHMYGGQDAVNWFGFWVFFASLLVMVGAWFAARPLILAPIASLFGKVGR
ncbi:cytochrome b/b6 domain-containing protein [Arthrobacter sp. zg-Y820]|uniref:cytochrome b/b6 domain-containing protein n=1 Tax=unclassified Arthrobacter TaxID=235627 RepID=UPI001E5CE87C|nr:MULTISPECIES: cytochrome b/b6 domain-containing protein [unclassified Arthrobacter]MCC9196780.1 cytochrome b/b6 domain-containing protein [Arthrobacter sp. zg-Y820]MDK1279642.1 cytochrome b/b6 domain-containing protein [Arthrobacter sp. zg.Y820]WIB07987.1 cytochrome b/b6 domain-containing protein [Arthrobacter sp. zg-Y820]